MEAIYIPQLAKAPEQTETVDIQDYLPGLETLTPVQGQVRVVHRGNYLEVSGQAETIVTLTCDRCLQQYNHRLALEASELIWLEEEVEETDETLAEREVAFADLVENLSPNGYFHPGEWLYEQLCLEIPQRQLCSQQCSGIQPQDDQTTSPLVDRRWASLEALKGNLLN
ncbi:DUF177 domain-containing protein [Oculatella sp. LEGE 06141]|uniref:YceD family protein n=1 Tax=Oculatella sp. LEGE 06141 TaxID=1828648 RepID=UPI00187EFBF9|nr:YceD family protein [Oculatella sp. LEGE 06141]MBE9177591.1 DUF177 domain-containing protein [Oculatella sp. LEGE 06141]